MIETIEEYQNRIGSGEEPLLGNELAIVLRVDIQNYLFGFHMLSQADIGKGNNRFYRWVWDHKPHVCEESGNPLYEYRSEFVSHILSRGAHPDMRWDPRNTNILNGFWHREWEKGNRRNMKIYHKNQIIIQQLKLEYEQCKYGYPDRTVG